MQFFGTWVWPRICWWVAMIACSYTKCCRLERMCVWDQSSGCILPCTLAHLHYMSSYHLLSVLGWRDHGRHIMEMIWGSKWSPFNHTSIQRLTTLPFPCCSSLVYLAISAPPHWVLRVDTCSIATFIRPWSRCIQCACFETRRRRFGHCSRYSIPLNMTAVLQVLISLFMELLTCPR